MLLQLKNTSYSRGSKLLFENLDLAINNGDRIGLVGHNGSGKTSLLSLLADQAQPDDGDRIARRGLHIGMMEQFIPTTLAEKPLQAAVLDVLPIAQRDTEQWRSEALLSQLGFNTGQFAIPLMELSGGQQNLALFARAQLTEPELLLMDEPGNHMDVAALTHLKHFLNHRANLTFLMISHDRDLLDGCCHSTVFLRDRRTYVFQLPYSHARAELNQYDQQAEHRRATEQKEIDRIRASSKRLAHWGKTYDNENLARKAKTMALRADKLSQSQTEVTRGSGLDLALTGDGLKSRTVFTLERLRVTVPDQDQLLLECEHLVAKPGDRIALLGANGTGKSTTIRRLLRAYLETEHETEHQIRFNPQTTVGYFDQELDGMSSDLGRFDWLAQQLETPASAIKQTLLKAGIAYADFTQPIHSLSGGEKARLRFMLLTLQNANLMILDEPTNHIDLESREQLEQQLINLNTTLLITSHDRTFIHAICNRFWVINDQRLREIEYLDDYYNDLEARLAPTQPTQADDQPDIEADQLLDRIQHLEDLLQADRARKPKFQKPDRQQAWQAELDQLWEQALSKPDQP